MKPVIIKKLSATEWEVSHGCLRAFATSLIEALDQADTMQIVGTKDGRYPEIRIRGHIDMLGDALSAGVRSDPKERTTCR